MRTFFIFASLSVFFFFSCNEKEIVSTDETPINYSEKNDVKRITNFLYDREFTTFEEALLFSKINFTLTTKSGNNSDLSSVSNDALVALNEMINFKLSEEMTLDNYREELLNILALSNLDSNSNEYIALIDAIEATISVVMYKLSFEIVTKGFWDSVVSVLKCVGGTVGSAGLGALAGAAVGTITLPVVGTVSGTAVGAVSGALVGAAEFC